MLRCSPPAAGLAAAGWLLASIRAGGTDRGRSREAGAEEAAFWQRSGTVSAFGIAALLLTERNLTFLAPTKSSRAARTGQALGLGVFDPSMEKRKLFGRMQGVGR